MLGRGGKSKYLCAPQLFYPLWGQKIRSRGGELYPFYLPLPTRLPHSHTNSKLNSKYMGYAARFFVMQADFFGGVFAAVLGSSRAEFKHPGGGAASAAEALGATWRPASIRCHSPQASGGCCLSLRAPSVPSVAAWGWFEFVWFHHKAALHWWNYFQMIILVIPHYEKFTIFLVSSGYLSSIQAVLFQ